MLRKNPFSKEPNLPKKCAVCEALLIYHEATDIDLAHLDCTHNVYHMIIIVSDDQNVESVSFQLENYVVNNFLYPEYNKIYISNNLTSTNTVVSSC